MTKKENIYGITKNLLLSLFVMLAFIILFTAKSYAAVEVTRDIYEESGSMKFNFTGLELDITHEYEFGFTKTAEEAVAKWYEITEYTDSTAIIDLKIKTGLIVQPQIETVMQEVDTGYITIRDKTDSSIVEAAYGVNLKVPYLRLAENGLLTENQEFGLSGFSLKLYGDYNKANYQYIKITDENIINEYKKIKEEDKSIYELEKMLTTTLPSDNWTKWYFWSTFFSSGYPQGRIKTPESGLYYLWMQFTGENTKEVYGYIIVDNLVPEISVESISLPSTKTVEVGKTITLTPTFNPSNATNKIVTWSSSNEEVVTVNNAGVVTGVKVGTSVITVTTQDGNKVAICTVAVTTANSNNANNANNNSSLNNIKDNTIAPGKLPETGVPITIALAISLLTLIGIVSFLKHNKFKGI